MGTRLPQAACTRSREVALRRYYVVLDLNGVLVHKSFDDLNRRVVKKRPHSTNFVDWVYRSANLVFWSGMTKRNVISTLDNLLASASFKAKDVTLLSQEECTMSSYRDPANPDKPFFLKDLKTLAKLLELNSLDAVVLVDDSPLKNLMNDRHSAIFPRTWQGDMRDMFLLGVLVPWLADLFKSNDPVPKHVQNNPLFHGQSPVDPLGGLGNLILEGTPR